MTDQPTRAPTQLGSPEPQSFHHLPGDSAPDLGRNATFDNEPLRLPNPTEQSFIGSRDSGTDKHEHVAFWNPTWLRFGVLSSYAALTLLFIVATIVLYTYSKQHDGFAIGLDSNHYTWKYGPTAVLTLALVFWNQSSRWCKIITPWQNLASGPKPAGRNLLLDYVSPLQPLLLWRAGRARDIAVVASELGTLIWRIAIILSTALLVSIPVIVTTRDARSNTVADFVIDKFNGTSTTGEAGRIYYGIHADNVQYPAGTAPTYAFQPIQLNDTRFRTRDYKLQASVDVFTPHFDCEPGAVTVSELQASSNIIKVNIRTSDCKVNFETNLFDPTKWSEYQLYGKGYPAENFVPNAIPIACDGRNYDTSYVTYDETRSRILLFLSLADENLKPTVLTAAICQPAYYVSKQILIYDSEMASTNSSTRIDWRSSALNLTLPRYFPPQFTFAVLEEASSQFLTLTNTDNISEAQSATSGVFTLMSLLEGRVAGKSTLRPFLTVEAMITRAQEVLQGVSVQLAGAELLQPAIHTVTSLVSIEENRLTVQLLPAISMSACFGLLSIFAVLLIYIRPRDAVPRRVEGPFETLCSLNSSLELKAILRFQGNSTDGQLTDSLCNRRFGSATLTREAGTRPVFVVSQEECPSQEDRTIPPSSGPWQSWIPWVLRPLGRIAVVTLVVITIVTLEVLQRLSNAGNGFVDIQGSRSAAEHAKSIVPSLAMVIIALIYGSLNDSTNILSPYIALAQGLYLKERRINWSLSSKGVSAGFPAHVHGRIPIVGFFVACRARYLASCFTIATAFIAPFLTIVTSGLYVIAPVDRTDRVNISLLNTFNASWTTSLSSGDEASASANQILNNGADYPQWTYQDLAFPALSSSEDELGLKLETQTANLTTILPALRGKLDCYMTRSDEVLYDITDNLDVNATIKILDTCNGNGGTIKTLSIFIPIPTFSDESSAVAKESAQVEQYTAAVVDLHVLDGTWNTQSQFVGSYSPPDNPAGCPSLLFYTAKISADATSGVVTSGLTAFSCRQILEEVQVNASFAYPAFTIDKSSPPRVDDSSVNRLNNGTAGFVGRGYQLANWLSQFQNNHRLESNASTIYDINSFYSTVISATASGAESELRVLFDDSNVDALLAAIEHGYGIYMAQAISGNMRTGLPLTGTNSASAGISTNNIAFPTTLVAPLHANLTHQAGHDRLKQDNPSKIALQVLLGTMAACAVAAWMCAPDSNVLPHSPNSIAGVASLFAGSDHLWGGDVLRDGAEWSSEAELRCTNLKLGWHDSSGGPRQGDTVTADEDNGREGHATIAEEKRRWFGIDTTE
ncbi:uncharacterized protein PV07_10930 [Cladophialophora immunda]|uniref:Uncharacterized protein n=1 Tax=Cladophialophora immunda TaxID=569365 RepID=A0A0D2BU98_9EURO|nr:uncharacterized protein PV07_10930 [Cladophialophora immunda]KIW22653.1 hypothetical protein PV07_10930 [Cladophialophora immunda]OQV08892.1 hypothetical protein CLAIMM_13101 [Cladophialophora immunda]